MASPRPPEQTPLMVLLEDAARTLQDRFLDTMAEAGHAHSLSASKVMGSLTTDGVRLSDLAQRLGVTKQSVGQIVDELESEGYVVRRPDPTDGRAKLIVFGPRGHEALPTAWRALRETDAFVQEALGDAGADALREALEFLLDHDPGIQMRQRRTIPTDELATSRRVAAMQDRGDEDARCSRSTPRDEPPASPDLEPLVEFYLAGLRAELQRTVEGVRTGDEAEVAAGQEMFRCLLRRLRLLP